MRCFILTRMDEPAQSICEIVIRGSGHPGAHSCCKFALLPMPFGRSTGYPRIVWLTSRTGARRGLAMILPSRISSQPAQKVAHSVFGAGEIDSPGYFVSRITMVGVHRRAEPSELALAN